MITLEELVSKPPVYLGNKEFFTKVKESFLENETWNTYSLEQHLAKNQYGGYPYINRGIHLLRFAGLLSGEDCNLHLSKSFLSSANPYEEIANCLIKRLHRIDKFVDVFPASAVSVHPDEYSICLSRNFMPLKYAPIWNMLRDILSTKQDYDGRMIYLPSTSALMRAFSLTHTEKERMISLQELQEIHALQSIAGAEAEKFVLKYERRRLALREDLSNLRIISDYNVSAGYDISSYNSVSSAKNDRFIEVKSFISTKPQFYWSKNEIAVSKRYRDNYFIYLIDRNQINNPGYEPIIVQDPSKNVLNSSEWLASPSGLFCQLN